MIRTRPTRLTQPVGRAELDASHPLARGLVFAINPSAGSVNLARSNWPSVNTELVRSTSASVLFSSGAANYSQSINNANGLTLFSILRSRDASQYLFSDGERSILSARNASNQGWTWSRLNAADIGGSRGNATRQVFTLNGIAAYSEANATIESFADVPVALRYVKSSGVISWFSSGRKSSNDTNGSTGGTVGGDLVFRRQGPYANNLQPYIDKTGLTLVFERALSDAEISAVSANPWQLFKPVDRRIWVLGSVGGVGPVDGSASMPTAPASLSAAGSVSISGAASLTTASATMAAAGSLPGGAEAAMATAPAILAASGALAIQGTAAMSTLAAMLAATGALPIVASGAMATGAAVMSADGALGSDATASASMTTAPATLASTGALPISASATQTTSAASMAATGDLAGQADGSASMSTAPATVAAQGLLQLLAAAGMQTSTPILVAFGSEPSTGPAIDWAAPGARALVPQASVRALTPAANVRAIVPYAGADMDIIKTFDHQVGDTEIYELAYGQKYLDPLGDTPTTLAAFSGGHAGITPEVAVGQPADALVKFAVDGTVPVGSYVVSAQLATAAGRKKTAAVQVNVET